MNNIYANHPLTFPFNEARYQTIGRSHGFAELNGVPFKLAEKYDVKHSSFMRMLENLHISTVAGALAEADAYTFDLEKRVLENMEQKGS